MNSSSLMIFGDQLSLEVPIFSTATPKQFRVVMVEVGRLQSEDRHPLRRALYGLSMLAFAEEVRARGLAVDYRVASTFTDGLRAHRQEYEPSSVVVQSPRGRRARAWCQRVGLDTLPDPFWLTDQGWFESLVTKSPGLTLETFYRHQRRREGYLMDGGDPCGGRWNFDAENRQPLPKDGGEWPEPWRAELSEWERDELDRRGLSEWADALAYWPRTRDQALRQLEDALYRIVPHFGPYEDAASSTNWHLAHSRLSVALNLGLLHPREVADGVEAHYRAGRVPLASAEGFLRQVIGWREWVAAWHRRRDEFYPGENALSASVPLPRAWRELSDHPMNCLHSVFSHVREYGWTHHIERLMVLANAATLAGYDPREVHEWMSRVFLDGAEWVMEANVIGMGLFADGGRTATKPYVAGGNYLSKMTNFCRGCAFSPKERTGSRACPLTTLYWQFFVDQADVLAPVHRVTPIRRAALAREDLPEITLRAPEARRLVAGEDSSRSDEHQ